MLKRVSVFTYAQAPFLPLGVDLLLLGAFAVQHSVMARPWFKRAWTRFINPAAERSTYVLFSRVALIALFAFWQPLGGVVWNIASPLGRTLMYSLFGLGFALVLVATGLINHFDLFGRPRDCGSAVPETALPGSSKKSGVLPAPERPHHRESG